MQQDVSQNGVTRVLYNFVGELRRQEGGTAAVGLRDLFRRKETAAAPVQPRFVPPPRQAQYAPPAQPAKAGAAQWIPPGVAFQAGGRPIPGGGVYVGRGLRCAHSSGVEPALIDPTLKVDWNRPDLAGSSMGYWPSYSSISPGARAAYLTWLANGRSAPNTPVGYVFLFFYGLERRAILDVQLDPQHPDLPLIAAEVRRLVGIYGGNGSFRSYATQFLWLLEASQAVTAELVPPKLTTFDRTWEVPFIVRAALGRYSAAGHPIPAEWALLWLRMHPEAYLRTPATRCIGEFDELFAHRYRARYGAGMVVKPPKARLSLTYRAASGGFQRPVEAAVGTLPDVISIAGPFNKLKDLASECTDALDSYSRYLGRNPDGAGTPGAVALLPDELLATHGGAMLESLRSWVSSRTTDGPETVALDDVVELWSPGRTTKLAKADAVAVATLLGKVGVGIEPDVRFGSSTPAPGSTVVLFPLPGGATEAPSPEFAAASTLVHLAAVVASADGSVNDGERRHLMEHLEDVLRLDAAERARLEAQLLWLVSHKSGLAGMKKRLDALDDNRRTAIGSFLVGVAAADGNVSPDEITMLTKLYKLLGLDETEVFRAVHALGTDAGPVDVAVPGTPVARWPIPAPSTPGSPAVQLDPDKIRARLAETATVTALLADIFSEEDDQPAAPPSPAADLISDATSVAGLDGPHSALAERLRAQPAWSRADAESAAAERGLTMLGAALDRINDAALEACGEPLVEGDDPLEINEYAAEELF